MHYELYIDSLFFINFIMNLYLLILVDRSFSCAAPPVRLALGAAAGALGFLLPIPGIGPAALRLGAGMALGTAGMLCLAFRVRSMRMFLKLLERLAVYSFGMGGAMLFLVRVFPAARRFLTGAIGVLGAGGLLFLLFCRFRYGLNVRNSICRAVLLHGGSRLEVNALIDSGNSLCEPVSGKPVCVVEKSVFEKLWPDTPSGFRVIPYHSIGKKRGIMPGYLLPGLQLEIEGMELFFRNVYVAVSNGEISGADEKNAESVKMIVNPGILSGVRKGRPQKRQIGKENDSENNITGQDAV